MIRFDNTIFHGLFSSYSLLRWIDFDHEKKRRLDWTERSFGAVLAAPV